MPRDPYGPPADLDAESRKLWRTVRTQMDADRTWEPVAWATLVRYVRAEQRARLARARCDVHLEREGHLMVRGSQGQWVQHPDVKTAREAETDAHKYAEALIITPEARKRHGFEPKVVGKFGAALAG